MATTIPKIDIYCHYAPPSLAKYISGQYPHKPPFLDLFSRIPQLSQPELRLAFMDEHKIATQVLVPLPWLESMPEIWNDPVKAAKACRLANEDISRVCEKYKGRFIGTALLPTTNSNVLIEEYHHAVHNLKLAGSAIYVGPTAVAPDNEIFEQLYKESETNHTPIWLHPNRPITYSDYNVYNESKHAIWNSLGWVYDTSVAMVHIAMSGVFRRYPNLKIVTHHGGGMIPFFTERFTVQMANFDGNEEEARLQDLKKFYCDTATFGYAPMNISQCLDFYESGKVCYGTDSPMDMTEPGFFAKTCIRSIMDVKTLGNAQRQDVFMNHALELLGPHGLHSLRYIMKNWEGVVDQQITSKL